ncbi:hypothetical protein ASZ78_016183 [Callipepla squamata]|uniref:Glutathione peroxidase 1 n=1 Tax=Callipepla squamata TaxID=9009 RepID=A0A226MDZ9_CALSU|nr:hypothetical protein ASZ78_016183 [Callipepla squamata]
MSCSSATGPAGCACSASPATNSGTRYGSGERGAGRLTGPGSRGRSFPQENATNEEILLSLEHVRPGHGFKPNFTVFEKCEVNGKGAHPLFVLLREALPFPHDDPSALMTNPQYIIWSPVCRNDISWNFEKFLVGPDGVPFRRYSRHFETIKIQDDIELLLQKVPKEALE